MTIEELIIKLKEFPQDWEVYDYTEALLLVDPRDADNYDEITLE